MPKAPQKEFGTYDFHMIFTITVLYSFSAVGICNLYIIPEAHLLIFFYGRHFIDLAVYHILQYNTVIQYKIQLYNIRTYNTIQLCCLKHEYNVR